MVDFKEVMMKENYYKQSVYKHKLLVREAIDVFVNQLLVRAATHDASKTSSLEQKHYINPVWDLAHKDIEYGSDEYKAECAKMGAGLKHHNAFNDHHPEYFEKISDDVFKEMDLLVIMEMLCDWVASAQQRGNAPSLALDSLVKKYKVEPQLEAILRNTLNLFWR